MNFAIRQWILTLTPPLALRYIIHSLTLLGLDFLLYEMAILKGFYLFCVLLLLASVQPRMALNS